MFNRKRKAKIPVVPLKPQVVEARVTVHARLAAKAQKAGNVASARYHTELAHYIHQHGQEPDSKQRHAFYVRSQGIAKEPFKKGKGKGYDVYPPDEGGPAILKGIAIVRGPDNWNVRCSSMQEALNYVRIHNVGDYPVRVHKKP